MVFRIFFLGQALNPTIKILTSTRENNEWFAAGDSEKKNLVRDGFDIRWETLVSIELSASLLCVYFHIPLWWSIIDIIIRCQAFILPRMRHRNAFHALLLDAYKYVSNMTVVSTDLGRTPWRGDNISRCRSFRKGQLWNDGDLNDAGEFTVERLINWCLPVPEYSPRGHNRLQCKTFPYEIQGRSWPHLPSSPPFRRPKFPRFW